MPHTMESMAARILIVDDNAALIDNLRDILEGAGEIAAEVSTALDGQAAVAFARTHGFDVALVDVKLPDGSGVDVVRALHSACPFGEVVLITGFATVDSALAALQAGAFAFLLKSFRPEELISTVEQAFAKVQLKREREELERRQRALIETAGVLILAVDEQDRVVLHNPKVAELTSSGIPVAVGRPFLETWIPEDGRERLEQAFARARAGGRTVAVEAGFFDGVAPSTARRMEWHLSAVQKSSTGPDLVYGIGVDVTERRALEKRAAEAEALSTMGALALGLAHEIRNPLNAAVLQLHLLGRAIDRLEVDTKGSMRQRVSIVESEIGRLERLLTEFLELARPRGAQIGPVDLAKLADAVLDLEGEALAMQAIRVVTELQPGVLVAGDPEKLKQVLINLVANARDVLREGGTLTLRTAGGDDPRLEVEDDGPGIDPAILENIFDPFFTTKAAGTGLGLAIVRKIVDQHRGTVQITSAPGEGTKVTVHLPKWSTGAASGSFRVSR
jgi:PAS domain S-box-containing protein